MHLMRRWRPGFTPGMGLGMGMGMGMNMGMMSMTAPQLAAQTSIQEAESDFTNNAPLQMLHSVLMDQKYIIIQKLILRSQIEKLYCRDYNEILKQSVYQSFKQRAVQKSNFEGLMRIYSSNKVIQGLIKLIEEDLSALFDRNLNLE